jgi:serine/threonine protein kinase
MTFAIGENVGPYRIIEQLGSGGMATVFKAYHAALDRYVAIKVLHPAFKQDPNFLSRFQREARIVAKLDQPHIVPVYDFSEAGGQPYLVMRYIEGETLKARLANGALPLAEVARIIKPVGDALSYAHAQGVLHRDVKPSNVLLTNEGGVFLADFGLARMAQAGESTLSQDSLLGTPQYISPEQARGDANLDARTDVYSLGVVLYELLVGRVPYQADTPYAVIHDHIYSALPLPRSLNPALSEPLERFLLKALSKERDDRYANIAEMLTAFEQAAQSATPTLIEPVAPTTIPLAPYVEAAPATGVTALPASSTTAATPVQEKQKSRKKLWAGLGIAVALVVVVAAVFLLTQPKPAAPQPSGPQPSGPQPSDPQPPPQSLAPQIEQLRQQLTSAGDFVNQDQPDRARDAFLQVAKSAEQIAQSIPGASDDQMAQFDSIAGEAWMAAGKPERAQPHFEHLTQVLSNRPEPFVGLAATQLAQNRLEAASRTVDTALALDPKLTSAHVLRACLLIKQGHPLLAANEFRLANGSDNKLLTLTPWVKLLIADLDCRPANAAP